MIVLGVTGGLASGKSTVAKIFKALGAELFDADASARSVSKKGNAIYKAIVKLFGKNYLKKDGQLDRKKIASRVFSSPKDLKKLQVLIHPGVIFDCMKCIKKLEGRSGVLILDVPLLYESGMEKLAHRILVVSAKPSVVMARSLERGYSKALTQSILKSQWPMKKKKALADFVIDNSGSSKQLEKKVRRVYGLIKGGSK